MSTRPPAMHEPIDAIHADSVERVAEIRRDCDRIALDVWTWEPRPCPKEWT